MQFPRRDFAATCAGLAFGASTVVAQDAAPIAKAAPGAITEESLGQILESLGLKPKKNEQRYDFTFATKIQEIDWNFSMSTVLSEDKSSVWIMAWLDELPRSARDVPRSALLRMLALNDKMGKGKFFSYIPAHRRFALQQVIDNRDLSAKKFRGHLFELGQTVALTYPQWGVEAWKDPGADDASEADEGAEVHPLEKAGGVPSGSPSKGGTPATNTAVKRTAAQKR